MDMYVIYKKPKDHPNHYVVRKWTVEADGVSAEKSCKLADSLGEVRKLVPIYRVRIDRDPGDDKTIVEVWV